MAARNLNTRPDEETSWHIFCCSPHQAWRRSPCSGGSCAQRCWWWGWSGPPSPPSQSQSLPLWHLALCHANSRVTLSHCHTVTREPASRYMLPLGWPRQHWAQGGPWSVDCTPYTTADCTGRAALHGRAGHCKHGPPPGGGRRARGFNSLLPETGDWWCGRHALLALQVWRHLADTLPPSVYSWLS